MRSKKEKRFPREQTNRRGIYIKMTKKESGTKKWKEKRWVFKHKNPKPGLKLLKSRWTKKKEKKGWGVRESLVSGKGVDSQRLEGKKKKKKKMASRKRWKNKPGSFVQEKKGEKERLGTKKNAKVGQRGGGERGLPYD